jgi:hypothetical protein
VKITDRGTVVFQDATIYAGCLFIFFHWKYGGTNWNWVN